MSSQPTLLPSHEGDASPGANSSPVKPESAWQRWEMTAITDEPIAAPLGGQAQADAEFTALEPVLLIDEAELSRLRLQAQEAGVEEGRQLGYAQGQAEGYAAAMVSVSAQAEQLLALTLALPLALREAERQIADDLVALALDIASQVLGQALKAEPQIILTVVRELLQAEPALTGSPQLVLHPDDAVLVKEHLADDLQVAGWRIRVDARKKRGGCRVLAANGEHDATLETRWERVSEALTRRSVASTLTVDD